MSDSPAYGHRGAPLGAIADMGMNRRDRLRNFRTYFLAPLWWRFTHEWREMRLWEKAGLVILMIAIGCFMFVQLGLAGCFGPLELPEAPP